MLGFVYILNAAQSPFAYNLLKIAEILGYILVAVVFLTGLVSILRRLYNRTKDNAAPQQHAASAQEYQEVTDGRVIAAVTAAIAAYYSSDKSAADSHSGFVVRSIKKRV